MINVNAEETLSLLLSIKYTHTKTTDYNYFNEPRPCHNFAFFLEGEGVITTNEETFYVKKGDILFIPQNTTYASTWIANPKTIFHSLHFSFLAKNDPFRNLLTPIQLLSNKNFEQIYPLMQFIESHQFSKDINYFLVLSAFYKLLGELLKNVKTFPKPTNKTILPAIKHIEKNYTSHISVEQLASLCFISPSRFFTLFKKQTGDSPIVYKNKIAVQHATQDLLYNKELSILEISEKHGFSNIIYFERLFKKLTGKSPSQYRKENNNM